MSGKDVLITGLEFVDVRFPTSLGMHGSDAMHKDPDYSAAYVIISTNDESLKGYGLTFTIGRGNEIIVKSMESLKQFIVGRSLNEIVSQFGKTWHDLVHETQLRWLGPEKGALHMATGGILNAVWDLWGRVEGKPVWKLLVDMEPEKIVDLIDFSYIDDFLSREEAIEILRAGQEGKAEREKEMREKGYPAYTTSAGWLGYTDEQIQQLCRDAMAQGFRRFKMKVGTDLDDDKRRMRLLRDIVGDEIPLMTDANQRWSAKEAIDWMTQLAPYKPYWIEEPTHPDDILAHAKVEEGLKHLGIMVVTGEHCANRVLFKQFLQCGAMRVCQVDACRLCSVNECLSVILMAAKANVPVCPHAGGVGLCEFVQHFIFFDYICVSRSTEGRMCEFADHLHEHFLSPARVKNGNYQITESPGYNGEMFKESVEDYRYPDGNAWQKLIADGKVAAPSNL